MPVAGIGAGAAQQVLQELQKQALEKPKGTEGFNAVLQKVGDANMQPQASAANPASQINQASQVNQPNQINQVNQLDKLSQVNPADKPKGFGMESLLNSFNKDQGNMDKLMKTAMSGKPMNQSDLILLQSATYKISFELESMSKFVESASNAVKTTMQTQV